MSLNCYPKNVLGDTKITCDIPEELLWNVNKNEIEQAFLAIIKNAVDVMNQKGQISVTCQLEEGDILLSDKDQGPGISAEALQKIFDPFYTTKPPGKGTGFGLTIASKIVKKYGGAVSMEFEVGVGTTFFLRFKKIIL